MAVHGATRKRRVRFWAVALVSTLTSVIVLHRLFGFNVLIATDWGTVLWALIVVLLVWAWDEVNYRMPV